MKYPSSLGTSDADHIRLLGHDLADDLTDDLTDGRDRAGRALDRLLVVLDRDRLQRRETVQRLEAFFATVATLLDAAKR